MIRVLLVDSYPAVRAGCARLLGETDDIVIGAETGDAESAYTMVVTGAFDVVVMELSLAGMSGLEACARIRSRSRQHDTRVLIFSAHEELLFVRRALAAGASGYLTKRASLGALVGAVRAVAAGHPYLDPRVQVHEPGPLPLEQLSRREFEVFRLLAEGYDTHRIAATLFLSTKTVANNATRLRAKLGISSAAQLTRLAIQYGVVKI